MSDFKVIETQEEFDKAISERLGRERAKYDGFMSPSEVEEKYKGYVSAETLANDYLLKAEVEEKYKGYVSANDVAELNSKLKKYESDSVKTRIAMEYGIPFEMANRLNGDDEASIREDAETISQFMKKSQITSPLASNEPPVGDDESQKYLKLAKKLKGE